MIDRMRALLKQGKYRLTLHALQRCDERSIRLEDIMQVILKEDCVHIITVHWLDPKKWLDPKTRREKGV